MTNPTEQDQLVIAIRPIIPQATVNEHTNSTEAFQNETLRPIIKYLNQHILSTVKRQITRFSKDFKSLNNQKKIVKLTTFLEKNQKIRYNLTGMVIGLMTLAELQAYEEKTSECNKRILKMIEERVIDHVDFF